MSRESARARLDDAVRAYVAERQADGDFPAGHVVIGWTLGIALTGLDDGQVVDADVNESMPGMHGMMARGLAEHTAERFAGDCWPDG